MAGLEEMELVRLSDLGRRRQRRWRCLRRHAHYDVLAGGDSLQLELISVAGRSGGAAWVAWRRETPEPGTAERLDADAVLFGDSFLCSRYVTVARLGVDASCSWAGERVFKIKDDVKDGD